MLNENFLLDEFEQSGTDLEMFRTLTQEIAVHTIFARVDVLKLAILSYVELGSEASEKARARFNFYGIDPKALLNCDIGEPPSFKIVSIKKADIETKGDFQGLCREMKKTGIMFFYNGTKCMFVSDKVLTGRMHPFGIDGAFLQTHSFGRSLVMAERFSRCKPTERTFVIREIKGVKKVFSILGKKYSVLPQVILMNIYEKLLEYGMGKVSCRSWNVTHFTSAIHVEFPDKAAEFKDVYGLPDELIPGLLLQTSDTGDSSLRIQGTWRRGDSVTLHREIVRNHRGEMDLDEIIKDVDDTIFSEYTKLPETLCSLMTEDVTDTAWDLASASGRSKNRKHLMSVMRNASIQLNLVKAIGKTAECQLMEQLIAELDESMAYTAYDIALHLMNAPCRVEGLHPVKMENLKNAVGRAPYIKYEAKKATSLTLTA